MGTHFLRLGHAFFYFGFYMKKWGPYLNEFFSTPKFGAIMCGVEDIDVNN